MIVIVIIVVVIIIVVIIVVVILHLLDLAREGCQVGKLALDRRDNTSRNCSSDAALDGRNISNDAGEEREQARRAPTTAIIVALETVDHVRHIVFNVLQILNDWLWIRVRIIEPSLNEREDAAKLRLDHRFRGRNLCRSVRCRWCHGNGLRDGPSADDWYVCGLAIDCRRHCDDHRIATCHSG